MMLVFLCTSYFFQETIPFRSLWFYEVVTHGTLRAIQHHIESTGTGNLHFNPEFAIYYLWYRGKLPKLPVHLSLLTYEMEKILVPTS